MTQGLNPERSALWADALLLTMETLQLGNEHLMPGSFKCLNIHATKDSHNPENNVYQL